MSEWVHPLDVARVGLAAAWLLVPGVALAVRLRSGIWQTLVAGVALGLVFGVLVAWGLARLGASLPVLLAVLGVSSTVALVDLARHARSRVASARARGSEPVPSDHAAATSAGAAAWVLGRGDAITAWGLAIGLVVFGMASTRPIASYSDVPDHLGTIRTTIETGALEPNDVFYAGGDGMRPDARKGFFHAWLAAVARVSGLDAVAFWYAVRPWLVGLVAMAGAFLAWAAGLRGVGFRVALVAVPLVTHGNAAWFLDTAAYPRNASWIPIWVLWGVVLRSIGEGSDRAPARSPRILQVAVVLLSLSLAPFHVFAPVLALCGLASVVAALIVGREVAVVRRLGPMLAIAGVCAVGPLLVRLVRTYAPINPLHTNVSEVFYLTDRLSLHALGPMFTKFSATAIGLAALSVFWLVRRPVRSPQRLALAGLAWAPLLVSLNPIAGGLLQPKIGYLFVRFLGIVPYPVIAGALVADAWRARWRGWERALVLVAVLVVLGGRVMPLANRCRPSAAMADLAVSPERWKGGLTAARAAIDEPRATVLTDPFTSYGLPAYAGLRVVATLDQHSSPSDSTLGPRLEDVARALSPHRPLAEAIDVLERRGVRYVLVNTAMSHVQETHFDVRHPADAPAARERFASSGAFRTISSEAGCTLYELVDPGARPDDVPLGDPTEATFRDTTVAGPFTTLTPELSMGPVTWSPHVLRPGDTLSVRVFLHKDTEVAPATPYRWVARARREGDGPAPWVSRLRRAAALLLHRPPPPARELVVTKRPLDGRYPVALWDVGSCHEDELRLVVPADAVPGTYALGVTAHEQSFVRNVALSDWLRASGGIGVPVGQLEIRPRPDRTPDAAPPDGMD